ncbi:MAG: hypothetical protein ACRDLM_07260 [Gaiellaceae bacterium]
MVLKEAATLGREMGRVIIASLAVAASLAIPAASATAAGGGWSKPSTLAPAGQPAYQPSTAIAANGTAVVVWDQYNATKNKYTLMGAIRTPRGKITKSKLGPAANAFAKPALAVGGDGTFAVAWEYPGASATLSALAVRILPAGKKGFGATAKVSGRNLSNGYGYGDSPSIAVDDAGDVFVAYEARVGSHYEAMETQKPKRARRWSRAVRLSAAGVDSHGARLAADGKGAVVVAWDDPAGSVWSAGKPSAAGSFSAPQKIASATYETSPADVAIADSGKAAVLWEQSRPHGTYLIASKVGHSRFPGKAQYLSAKGISRYQGLALSSNGAGVAAWEEEVAGGWQIKAATLTAAGSSWSKETRIIPAGYAATFGAAPVVAANNQRAVIAWSEKNLHHASFVGVRVRVGSRWSKVTAFSGLNTPVVAVPNDPKKSGPVAGAMIWLSTSGLQISILKP